MRGAWGRVCGERQTNGQEVETVRMGTGEERPEEERLKRKASSRRCEQRKPVWGRFIQERVCVRETEAEKLCEAEEKERKRKKMRGGGAGREHEAQRMGGRRE